MYVGLLFEITSPRSNKIYHYLVPPSLASEIAIGKVLLAPFGKRLREGYVVEISDHLPSELKGASLKAVLRVLDHPPLFDEKTLRLARWLSGYYACFLVTALKAFLPPLGKQLKQLSVARVARPRKMLLPVEREEKQREQVAPLTLTAYQQTALDHIEKGWDEPAVRRRPILLYGVTGSGKTEVYLRAIEQALVRGRQALVIFPEIALTTHMVARFHARFGSALAVWHSHLTPKERRETWGNIACGACPVVIGTRSALFTPLPQLGLIVLDEEYEAALKQETHPRYHARTVATFLREETDSLLILGSATSSLETYFRAQRGEYQLLRLPERIDRRPLPKVSVIDLRAYTKPWRGWISPPLQAALLETISRGEQAILFFNRRGFSTFLVCRSCGESVQCPRCSVSLTYHREGVFLGCHHCNFRQTIPVACAYCQSGEIDFLGAGTQKVALEVKRLFPQARLLRLDRDIAERRGKLEEVLTTFEQGGADILLGTQMVVKGFDFHRVTLVGVLSADTSLSFPDFRSAEQTFQLLAQVAGRAGRHSLPGRVLIQTFLPDHDSIQAAIHHDYEAFYRQEIQFREKLNYPPFCHLINIVVSGRIRESVFKAIETFTEMLLSQAKENLHLLGKSNGHGLPAFEMLGPAPCPIEKRRGDYRAQCLIKTSDLAFARQAISQVVERFQLPARIQLLIDVDPYHFM